MSDARTDRLSPAATTPDQLDDPIHIAHRLEVEDLRREEAAPPSALRVVSWNIERGFGIDGQIAALTEGPDGPPDVVLVQEADRGLDRTDGRHITRELADALGATYVFATEFVELPPVRDGGPLPPSAVDEHGNAIVSRHRLSDVAALRFTAQRSWYRPPDVVDPVEPRIGGRIAVAATIEAASGPIRVASVHLESEPEALDIQAAQASEAAEWVAAAGSAAVVGGDLNAYWVYYDLANGRDDDRTLAAFLERGWVDAHADLPVDRRPTVHEHGLDAVIDFILVRGLTATDPWVGSRDRYRPLSDHQPIAATVS